MNKSLVIASICAAVATSAAIAQSTGSPASAPAPVTRAADLNKMMEIRGWQAGPSSGDATARIDAAKSVSPAPAPAGAGLDTALQHESTP